MDDDDLRRPQRLTVGVADNLLGQLGPDGRTLYFVSNRDTTHEIFAQSMVDGRARALRRRRRRDLAAVPRTDAPSYVSFRESRPAGCVSASSAGRRTPMLEDSFAALQAEWIDRDGSRSSAGVDRRRPRILDVTVGASLSARPLTERNMTSPASPRVAAGSSTCRSSGPFSSGPRVRCARLGDHRRSAAHRPRGPAGENRRRPARSTGQPVFRQDGRSLYFVQFFTDTNPTAFDGRITASSFDADLAARRNTGAGPPERSPRRVELRVSGALRRPPDRDVLSSDTWTLFAAARRRGPRRVDQMPMLANAIDDADTLVEEQLLTSRRLARETTPSGRRRAMLALAMLHLERQEFSAAEYYAIQVDTLRDEATAGISLPLRMLVEERWAERRREQGRLIEEVAHRGARPARKAARGQAAQPDGRGPDPPCPERDLRRTRRRGEGTR